MTFCPSGRSPTGPFWHHPGPPFGPSGPSPGVEVIPLYSRKGRKGRRRTRRQSHLVMSLFVLRAHSVPSFARALEAGDKEHRVSYILLAMSLLDILASWTVIGVIVPFCIGVGIGVMSLSPPEFGAAKICFSIAALLLIRPITLWLMSANLSTLERMVVGFLVFGTIGTAWIESILWITRREPKPIQEAEKPTKTDTSTLQPRSPEEVIHPQPNGVLWRWNPEIGADGPFCPTHRESLSYVNFLGGIKPEFEWEFLGTAGWFVCPIDNQEFKVAGPYALRVRNLRAEAYARLQTRISQQRATDPTKRKEDESVVVTLKNIHVETKWRGRGMREFRPFLHGEDIPSNATLAVQVRVKITVTPSHFVEHIWLELPGERIEEQDWIPTRIGEQETYLLFRIPPSMAHGKYLAQLTARIRWESGGFVDRRLRSLEVIIARSYSDLQKFSGTS